jgi:hypothetical protein
LQREELHKIECPTCTFRKTKAVFVHKQSLFDEKEGKYAENGEVIRNRTIVETLKQRSPAGDNDAILVDIDDILFPVEEEGTNGTELETRLGSGLGSGLGTGLELGLGLGTTELGLGTASYQKILKIGSIIQRYKKKYENLPSYQIRKIFTR